MLKKFLFGLVLLFCTGVCTGVLQYAPTAYAVDVNGVEVTEFTRGDAVGFDATWFSTFNPTSTSYIYNEAGGTSTTSGALDTGHIFAGRTIQVSIPTLGSTSIDVRIEGRNDNSVEWSNIWTENYAAATTIADIINVLEYTGNIRVGAKVNTNGTDVIDITGAFVSERKR